MKSPSLKATHTFKEVDCTENDGGVGYFYIMKNIDRWARKVNARITFICDLSDHLKIILKCVTWHTPRAWVGGKSIQRYFANTLALSKQTIYRTSESIEKNLSTHKRLRRGMGNKIQLSGHRFTIISSRKHRGAFPLPTANKTWYRILLWLHPCQVARAIRGVRCLTCEVCQVPRDWN